MIKNKLRHLRWRLRLKWNGFVNSSAAVDGGLSFTLAALGFCIACMVLVLALHHLKQALG